MHSEDKTSGRLLSEPIMIRWAPIAVEGMQGWSSSVNGDRELKGEAKVSIAKPHADLPQPGIGNAIQLDYQFPKGWKFARIIPPDSMRAIDSEPSALGL